MVYDLLQAMEHRYNLLADVQSKTVAEKERLGKENEVLRQVSLRPVSTWSTFCNVAILYLMYSPLLPNIYLL